MFAIIASTAATLGLHGHTNVDSAAAAAKALRPVAGKLSSLLFAAGFIGSGFLAVPVLAGSGASALAGLLHKSWGYSNRARQAPVYYALVGLGTIGGTLLALLQINTIKLLVIVAVINGLAAAPFLIVVMLVSGRGRGVAAHGRLSAVQDRQSRHEMPSRGPWKPASRKKPSLTFGPRGPSPLVTQIPTRVIARPGHTDH